MLYNFSGDYLYSPNYMDGHSNRFRSYNITSNWIHTAIGMKFIEIMVNDPIDLPAYTLGLIDEKGKIIRQPRNAEEKDQINFFTKAVLYMKKALQKRYGSNTLKQITDPMLLLRDNTSHYYLEQVFYKIKELNDPEIDKLVEETFSGDISNVGTGFTSNKEFINKYNDYVLKLLAMTNKSEDELKKKLNKLIKRAFNRDNNCNGEKECQKIQNS